MHQDVAALLAVQEDDVVVHELEMRLGELAPRLEALDAEREEALAELAQAQQAVESEERRQREVQGRIGQHRQLQDRNQSVLDNITNEREAAAASAQLDQARRMTQEDEHELQLSSTRMAELRSAVAERQHAADDAERRREEARATLGADSRLIEAQLTQARADRDKKAQAVPRTLLRRYERIRSPKRLRAVFPLEVNACGNCNTLIPLQRRTALMGTGETAICEGCGVLLYAGE